MAELFCSHREWWFLHNAVLHWNRVLTLRWTVYTEKMLHIEIGLLHTEIFHSHSCSLLAVESWFVLTSMFDDSFSHGTVRFVKQGLWLWVISSINYFPCLYYVVGSPKLSGASRFSLCSFTRYWYCWSCWKSTLVEGMLSVPSQHMSQWFEFSFQSRKISTSRSFPCSMTAVILHKQKRGSMVDLPLLNPNWVRCKCGSSALANLVLNFVKANQGSDAVSTEFPPVLCE